MQRTSAINLERRKLTSPKYLVNVFVCACDCISNLFGKHLSDRVFTQKIMLHVERPGFNPETLMRTIWHRNAPTVDLKPNCAQK